MVGKFSQSNLTFKKKSKTKNCQGVIKISLSSFSFFFPFHSTQDIAEGCIFFPESCERYGLMISQKDIPPFLGAQFHFFFFF